jgi:hypothetical protein
VELLIKVKALISAYSYDEAINLLEDFFSEKSLLANEKIPEDKYQEIKEAYGLLFHIIELKDDEILRNKTSISKIIFLSKSKEIEDAVENIRDIESYLKRTQKQFGFIVNILWQAYYKIGELEKASVTAEKYLDELLKFKHHFLFEKSRKNIIALGIHLEDKQSFVLTSGIRLENHLQNSIEAREKDNVKAQANLLYESIMFFNDERIVSEISELAIARQNKRLLLSVEKFVISKKINNKKIEKNISRFSNFPDQPTNKLEGEFDFAEDLFAKKVSNDGKAKRSIQKEKELTGFTPEERYTYLDFENVKTEKDLLNLVDDEENFLELSSFLIELGLNRKALKILEKYLLRNLKREKLRELYHLYIRALMSCGEKSLAYKVFNDFCLNSSLSVQEKAALEILFKRLDADNQ